MAFLESEAFERLEKAQRENRFPHACLLSGPEGSGKHALVTRMASLILQGDPEQIWKHPDMHVARPESKSRRIITEQIRDLQKGIYRKSLYGGNKVVVIEEADRLMPQSANAFLKTLEEPPSGAYVFLLSTHPDMLLETILSRCMHVTLRVSGSPSLSGVGEEIVGKLAEVGSRLPHVKISEAVGFTRYLQDILQQTKTRIQDAFAKVFALEKKQWKDTVDESWLRGREEQMKAQADAETSMERSRILHVVHAVFAEALKRSAGIPSGDTPFAKAAIPISLALDSVQLLDRLEKLDALSGAMQRTVNETLTLESAFLEIFCPLPQ